MLTKEQKQILEDFLFDLYFIYEKDRYLYSLTLGKEKVKQKYFRTDKVRPTRKTTKTLLDEFVDLIESKENVFFTPNIFYKTKTSNRSQKFVKGTRCLYFDIDNVKNVKTKEDIIKYLEQFEFLKKGTFYPNYCLSSGNGLHLYFLIDELDIGYDEKEQREQYRTVLKKICYLLKSDPKAVDIVRVLRIPFSYNCKSEEIQTELFKMNDDEDNELFEIDEIENYVDRFLTNDYYNQNQKKQTKAREKAPKQKKTNEPVHKQEYEYILTDERKERIKIYKSKERTKRQRVFFDRVDFLENQLLPYRNYDIKGYRNSFIFIITKLYQNALKGYEETLEHCLSLNKCFTEPLTEKEILDIVDYTYSEDNKNVYIRITNKGIKNLLNITPEEQDLNYSVIFYDEVKRYKNLVKCERYNKKEKIKKMCSIEPSTMEIKYMKYFQILEQNPKATNKELAELMDLKLRQVSNIKNKYKEYLNQNIKSA